MSDILGKEITAGDIVVYAKREDKKQSVGIGIVVDPNHRYGRDVRVKVIPLSSKHAKLGQFKVGYNLMSAGTPVVHVNDCQVLVMPDKGLLPEGLEDALVKSLGLRERALVKEEESRLKNKEMTPSQRWNRHVTDKRVDDAISHDLELNSLLESI